MNRHPTQILARTAVLLCLMAGLGLTVYGLTQLSVDQTVPSRWRWTNEYLLIFLLTTATLGILGLWRGAVFIGFISLFAVPVMMGAVVALASVLILGLAAFTVGRLFLRSIEVTHCDALLAGAVLIASFLSLMIHLPVNNPGTWSLLLLLPMIVGHRHLRDLFNDLIARFEKLRLTDVKSLHKQDSARIGWLSIIQTGNEWHIYLLKTAMFAACLLHLLIALMPEIGHDALATHLMVPMYIARHQYWHFDVETYTWAVMPLLIDWLYAVGYLFGGETGARMVNTGSLFLLANVVHRLSLWVGVGKSAAVWGTLIFLLTPLTFLEGSSLFIEGSWTAFVLGGTLALCRLVTNQSGKVAELQLSAVLLGGALAAKAVSFTILPVLGLAIITLAPRWFIKPLALPVVKSIGLCLSLGSVPYACAYIITGNPVFPFFNAVFRSPLYPLENFKPPDIFDHGLHWDTLYRIVFDSGRHLEATAGASGFQWLLLVAPGLLIIIMLWLRRSLFVIIVGSAWLALVFWQTAYLRYAFPVFGLACTVIAVVIHHAKDFGRLASAITLALAVFTVLLNLLHLNSGTYYGKIDSEVITNPEARDAYIEKTVPVRSIISTINSLNHQGSPVAFFAPSMVAGLHAKALLASWYNPRFQSQALAISDGELMMKLLSREGVEYFVVDDNFMNGRVAEIVENVSTEMARVGPVSARRIPEHFRYSDELLPSTDMTAGWHLEPGATREVGGGLRVSVHSPAFTVIPTRPMAKYRYSMEARCGESTTEGRLQVNWLSTTGQLVRADIEVFTCTEFNTARSMYLLAPRDATQAVVYASAHSVLPIIFTRVSLTH